MADFASDGVKNSITVNGNLAAGSVVDSSDFGAADPATKLKKNFKFNTKILNYPLDIDDPSGSGHYIIFRINVQDKGKLSINESKTSIKEFEQKLKAELFAELQRTQKEFEGDSDDSGAPSQGLSLYQRDKIREDLLKKLGIVDFDKTKAKADSGTGGRKDSSSIQLQNPTTKRVSSAIALYMPQQILTAYQSKYEEDDISIAAETAGGAILSAMSGGGFKGVAGTLGAGAEEGVRSVLQKGAALAAPGSQALMAIHQGKVITPKMELMFRSVGRRSFSYEFNFIPKSEKEAIEVEKIVFEFKMQMSADFAGGGVQGQRRMTIPSTFDIEYMYKGQGNSHLHKISTCVLEKMDVTYGGDKFVAYAGGRPQSTKISLKFSEMEIITKKRVEEGY